MRILLASSEAVPYAKTGGLADVATGLSKALARAGHDVTLVLPLHRRFIQESKRGEPVALIRVDMRQATITATVRRTLLPGTTVEVLFVDQPTFFDRASLYTEHGADYADNAERFIFFNRAVFEIARTLTRPNIIHVNDWQTGLLPALVKHDRTQNDRFARTGTVLTIHNMAFHGHFPAWQMELTGLPQTYFNWQQMEYYGCLNLLKTAIAMSDMVTTVSPTYAREICRPEFGYGMDPLLLQRGHSLVGILNGVDTQEWNPATDNALPATYSVEDFATGKAACKAALQKELGLKPAPDSMLFGLVSRLTEQKGLDLIAAKGDELLQADVQLAVLGTGDRWFEDALKSLAQRYPGRVSVTVGFNEGLAHRIEAGCDAYLMPSRFEPCGLNQQYSLIYGTPPIVHAVGGLADSVVDATEENLARGIATGVQFWHYNADAYMQAVWWAFGLYTHRKAEWEGMIRAGMTRDSSWNRSAQDYLEVYQRAIQAAGSG